LNTFFPIAFGCVVFAVGLVLWGLTGREIWQRQWANAYRLNPMVRLFAGSSVQQPLSVRIGRVLLRMCGVVAVLFGAIILAAVWVLHHAPFTGETFEPDRWRAAGSCRDLSDWECEEKLSACPRGAMVGDLLSNHIMVRQSTRDDVLGLLGAARYSVDIDGHTCDGYRLGMCSGWGWDYDSLYICYDAAGVVGRSGHLQH
jgi:hypothetical protein